MKATTLLEKFWKNVNTDGPTPQHCHELGPCWVWTGVATKEGYGRIWHSQNGRRRHIMASHVLLPSPVPSGFECCHKCDNPRCVRPSHTFIATHKQNMEDCARKGRISPKCAESLKLHTPHESKEKHPMAVLKQADVDFIRPSTLTYRVLAERFGVCTSTIWSLKKGRHWIESKSPQLIN